MTVFKSLNAIMTLKRQKQTNRKLRHLSTSTTIMRYPLYCKYTKTITKASKYEIINVNKNFILFRLFV